MLSTAWTRCLAIRLPRRPNLGREAIGDLLLPRLVGGEVDAEKIAINVEELNA